MFEVQNQGGNWIEYRAKIERVDRTRYLVHMVLEGVVPEDYFDGRPCRIDGDMCQSVRTKESKLRSHDTVVVLSVRL